MVAAELVLQAADAGWIGTPRWRSLAYGYGAFWPGLLGDWRPNYGAQPVLMFVTYAFLHADFSHLLGNAIALAALGVLVIDRAGLRGFALIFMLAALGGALIFWALNTGPRPVVGASGAIFGLAGALSYWQTLRRDHLGPLLGAALALSAANVIMWLSTGGQIAWQAHLGGYLAGLGGAAWLADRGRISEN